MSGNIEKGRLVTKSGNLATASCKHRKSGACGGCYARLYFALLEIEEGANGSEVVASVNAAMLRDKP